MGVVAHLVGLGPVGAVHVDEDDAAALVGEAAGEVGELAVDVLGAGVGARVEVDDEGGEDDGGVGGGGPEVVEQVVHAAAGVVDVEVLRRVVGADVDGVDVGQDAGHVLLRLALHLLDAEAGVALVLVVLHAAARLGAYHVDGVAGAHDLVAELGAVAVAVRRADAEGDGGAEGHQAHIQGCSLSVSMPGGGERLQRRERGVRGVCCLPVLVAAMARTARPLKTLEKRAIVEELVRVG